MGPNTLRGAILRHLSEHEATGTGALCSDDQLVDATGAEKADVHRQLDVLENEGLVRLTRTFGPRYDAWLTSAGTVAVERLTAPPTSSRPIGY